MRRRFKYAGSTFKVKWNPLFPDHCDCKVNGVTRNLLVQR